MNTEIQQSNTGSGNWIAFLVGAIFNVMASINFNRLLEHALIALIGGVIWLIFQIIANRVLMGNEAKGKVKIRRLKKWRSEREKTENGKS